MNWAGFRSDSHILLFILLCVCFLQVWDVLNLVFDGELLLVGGYLVVV